MKCLIFDQNRIVTSTCTCIIPNKANNIPPMTQMNKRPTNTKNPAPVTVPSNA